MEFMQNKTDLSKLNLNLFSDKKCRIVHKDMLAFEQTGKQGGSIRLVPGSRFGGEFLWEMRWYAKKKIISTAYILHIFAANAVNRGEVFIFTAFSVFQQKRSFFTRLRTSYLLHSVIFLVDCQLSPTITYVNEFSCEFKSDSVNVGKPMRWNFCKKCGKFLGEFLWEMRWVIFFTAFTAFTAFLTLIYHKSRCGEFLEEIRRISWWIFVRSAVKYFFFTAFTTFRTKFPKNLDPGSRIIIQHRSSSFFLIVYQMKNR